MAEQSKDSQEQKTEAEKKAETVLLTAEELRAVAGGAGYMAPPPKPVSNTTTLPK